MQKFSNKLLQTLARQQKYNFSIFASHRNDEHNSESVPFDFTPENYKQIEKILAKYPKKSKKSGIMPLLWLAQEQNDNWVPLSAMKKVAKILEVSDMEVYEVATFYTMYNRTPIGKFQLQICGTTPCMVTIYLIYVGSNLKIIFACLCGAKEIIKTCEEYCGCKLGETSADGMWTINEVECLGACANAPMMQVNNQWVYEDLTPENTKKLLDDLQAGTEKKGPQTHRINAEGPQGRTTLEDKDFLNSEQIYSRDFAAAKQQWEDKKKAEQEAARQKKK
ncbi:Thioredoxin-like fold [Pseudocohnilembus persalinus]|uniref:Thioredoxin-like fold n=1 Tax=Pseudocohnilembus persalinus TaxID=266149 RepID=A0A0V0QY54_PSEPJ|nr:Thioredoxin-like fold [Pseudocohnilembus persalinus]|eukprot:KRX07140.1 Thioredoxin-like fold [Pseudocohnilembus persalinus]